MALGTALVAALAIAGAARPAAAQGTVACGGCDDGPMSMAQHRAYEAQAQQLREQIAELLRKRSEPELRTTLRQVDSVLRTTDLRRLSDSRGFDKLQKQLERANRAFDDDDGQLRLLARQLASLEMRMAMTQQMRIRMPAGYLGITYSGDSRTRSRNGELFVQHQEYPAIISVEPGSPAWKSGIRQGDTLLAYNGQDVVKDGEVPLSQLLQPGAKVTLRLRRGGAQRAVPVIVGTRRMRFEREMPETFSFEWQDPMPPMPTTPAAPTAPTRARVRVYATPAPDVPSPTPPAMPALAPEAMIFYPGGGGTAVVAGAEVTRMNEDLREVFGTDRGVLVLNVAEGSPAAQSGLRGGDVIVRVGGEPLSSPMGLRTAIVRARGDDARKVSLEVVRKKKTKTVVLAW